MKKSVSPPHPPCNDPSRTCHAYVVEPHQQKRTATDTTNIRWNEQPPEKHHLTRDHHRGKKSKHTLTHTHTHHNHNHTPHNPLFSPPPFLSPPLRCWFQSEICVCTRTENGEANMNFSFRAHGMCGDIRSELTKNTHVFLHSSRILRLFRTCALKSISKLWKKVMFDNKMDQKDTRS